MKQLSNSLFKKFRLFIYQNLILILIALILIAVSCGEDRMEIPDPEPTTETVSKIYQSGRSNETWKGWKDGSAVITTTTNNDAKEAKLSKTITVNKSSTDKNTANKSATFSLDSVTAYDGNYLVFKDKNVSLTSNPQTVDISDKKVSYSHIIEWIGNNSESWWKGWKNGKAYPDQKAEQTGATPARIIYKFFNDENTTTLDSLVGEASGYKTIVAKNITVKDYLAYKGGNSYGEFIFVRDNSGGESSTGDVAIRINHEGKDKSQSTITMTHTTLPQHTYGPFDTGDEIRHIFEDIYVDPDGSADYKVTVTSNLQDFLTTEAFVEIVEDVSGEKNGVKDVFVTDVPHEQTITWTIHDSKTKNTEEGVFIEVYKAFDDPQYGLILGEYITGATSDSQGKASVTIPDNTEIMTRTSRYDSYLKTVGTHFVQNVEFTYEMTDELNTTNLEIQFDESTGAQITAAQLNRYRPTPNFEWSNGHAYTYFEPGSEQEAAIEGSKKLAKDLGKEGAIIVSDYKFQDPTQTMIANYNPTEDTNTYPGQIGSNWEVGSGTTNDKRLLPNGTKYVLHTPVFRFSNAVLSHEWFQRMGFSQISDNNEEGIISCLDGENRKEATPMDIKMSHIYYGTNDFSGLVPNSTTLAPNGKPYEYSIKIKKFE